MIEDLNGKVSLTDNVGEQQFAIQIGIKQMTAGRGFNTYTIRSFDKKHVKLKSF